MCSTYVLYNNTHYGLIIRDDVDAVPCASTSTVCERSDDH